MDAIELNKKGLEETITTLLRCSTEFNGQFKPILEPVIHQYKVLYFKLTGENYMQRQDYIKPSKPPILPRGIERPHVTD